MPENSVLVNGNEKLFSDTELLVEDVGPARAAAKVTEDDGTIRRLLNSYELGHKLRQLRLRKKIALVDLGRHTGLSASMLSQLENGKLVPTLPTLARIAMVFDVGLEHFFSEKRAHRTFSIVRAAERLRFPDVPGSPVPGFFFEVLAFGATEKSISAYLAEFPRRDENPMRHHQHDGAEFVHLLEGALAINYQAEDHVLNAGDSVYFDASEAHAYCGLSEEPARAIVITSVPRL
ncbi:MAG: cupin domain-containing protein [Acidobacteriaceae bacterium]|nr:cupin domain-containing protein [Acidobacteriaceae bacterium]